MLALGIFGYARLIEPRSVRTRHFVVGVPDLAARLDGLKIAFVSDFHVAGPGSNRVNTLAALDLLHHEQPDLILLGGDYFDDARWEIDDTVFEGLRNFENVIAILGNHDYRKGQRAADSITESLEEIGVTMLRNSSTCISLRGEQVVIVGLDDPYTERDNLKQTFETLPDRANRVLVLLAHSPAVADRLPVGSAALVLSGHTHGGQIRLSPSTMLTPLDYSWYIDRLKGRPTARHQRGFHWVNGNLLYVTNGLGMTRWPLRFLAPPEVTFFHLTTETPHPDEPCDSPERYVEVIS